MQTLIYELPEITFVAGDNQKLDFRLVLPDKQGVYEAGYMGVYCSALFSVNYYMPHKYVGDGRGGHGTLQSPTIFSLRPKFQQDEDGVYCILHVDIPSKLTMNLYGKYIYQFILLDRSQMFEVPLHGILYVTRNTNQPTLGSWLEAVGDD